MYAVIVTISYFPRRHKTKYKKQKTKKSVDYRGSNPLFLPSTGAGTLSSPWGAVACKMQIVALGSIQVREKSSQPKTSGMLALPPQNKREPPWRRASRVSKRYAKPQGATFVVNASVSDDEYETPYNLRMGNSAVVSRHTGNRQIQDKV